MGRYRLGLACGMAFRIAEGTAMYEALAPNRANSNIFPALVVINDARYNAIKPLKKGISVENRKG